MLAVLGTVVAVLGGVVSGLVLSVVRVGEFRGVVVLAHLVVEGGRHNSGVLVMEGTGVGLVLELNMRLLLMELLVVRVLVVGHFVVDAVLVDDGGLVVMVELLVVALDTLDVVAGLLVVVLLMNVLAAVVKGLGVEVTVVAKSGVLSVVVAMEVLVDGLVNGGLVVGGDGVLVRGHVVMGSDAILSGLVVVVSGVVVTGVVVVDGVGVVTGVLVDGVSVVSVASSVMSGDGRFVMGGDGEVVNGDVVLHLSTEEDLGETETDGVTELVEVLVLPLGLSVHDFVVNILAVHDKIVLDVEDEVPRVSESLGHLAKLVEISAGGGLALLELVGDIVNDVTEILNGVEDGVEGTVLELVDNTTEALPDVLGITEALNTVRNLSLDGTGKETLKDLAHAEEGEVDVGGLHGLEVVHLLVLLVVNLVKELLPVVVEIVEEFLVVNHLGLSVKEHGGGLAEMLTSIEPLAHAVVVETLTSVLEDVDTVDDE